MSVKLTKGQGVNLRKDAPNLQRILIGLGWDPVKKSVFSEDMDIDASVICIDEHGRKESVVFFGNLNHRSGAIMHHGDNLTGAGEGDDEQIEVLLDKVPSNIFRLSFIVNIFKAHSRNQDFGSVRNCFVHVDDMDTNKELVRYDVDGNYAGMTGIFVADLYRYNGDWRFKALGQGVDVAKIGDMVAMKCN